MRGGREVGGDDLVAARLAVPVVALRQLLGGHDPVRAVAALDEHRAGIELAQKRTAARRASALADFAAEHGERGVRELGGRRAAMEFLSQQDAGLDVPALTAALEARRS
jgi:LAO/AO transport system kinase